MNIDESVLSLQKTNSASEFKKLSNYFDYLFRSYYKSIARRSLMSREDFFSEYEYVLFKAIGKFKPDAAKAEENQFERYLNATMKRFVCTIRRKHIIRRKTKILSLNESAEDLVDTKPQQTEDVDFADTLNICKNSDRKIAVLKTMGHTSEDVCKMLSITSHEYRLRIKSLKANHKLLHSLSS
jgi:hypothetical protein